MAEERRNNLWIWGLVVGVGVGAILAYRRRQKLRRPLPGKGRERRVAVVTGASSGIGAVYAERLAAEGYDVVLVARRETRLQALAEELRRRYGTRAEVMVADLADAAEVARLEDYLRSCEDLVFLVNNAGFGSGKPLVETELEGQDRMVRVNVIAPLHLTHAALPGMLARGEGAIVNVASVAAFYPLDGSATYSATKAFLKAFTEALHHEVRGTGVRVQALCPGLTRTEFHATAQIEETLRRLPDFVWSSPEEVVETSLRDLKLGRVVSIPGRGYHLVSALACLVPRDLAHFVRRRLHVPSRKPLPPFPRRIYPSVGAFLADMRYMLRNRERVRWAMRHLDVAFRERLMLAVTQVNGCRYCSYYHARLALQEGLSPDEVQQLLDGIVEHCPPDEATALFYAQHWAETEGHPDPQARQKLVETYGSDMAEAIEITLRVIKMGNYLGNTTDYFLYRLSRGRWGNVHRRREG